MEAAVASSNHAWVKLHIISLSWSSTDKGSWSKMFYWTVILWVICSSWSPLSCLHWLNKLQLQHMYLFVWGQNGQHPTCNCAGGKCWFQCTQQPHSSRFPTIGALDGWLCCVQLVRPLLPSHIVMDITSSLLGTQKHFRTHRLCSIIGSCLLG